MESNKTNKELAVDVAIAYINNVFSQVSQATGIQSKTIDIQTVCGIIKETHKMLSSLDDK